MIDFITGRIKAIFYSLKGAFLLLKTEHSIQAQSFIASLFILAGFHFEISKLDWLFQILAICLVLTAEFCHSCAIEKIADFIHPDFNKKIGFIKDIAAGAVFFAAVFAIFVIYNIYWDKLL